VSASTSPRKGSRLAPVAAALAAATAGGIFGLAAARLLFELDPLKDSTFGTGPGALALAGVGAAIAAGLSVVGRRLRTPAGPGAGWAPIVLALPLISLLSPEVNLLRAVTLLAGALALLALLLLAPAAPASDKNAVVPSRGWPLELFLSLSLFLSLFLLYLRTLAPAVGQADTFEFQVGVARLGIAHGSGYPLLILIGRLFTLLPVGGTLAFRANLTSAFFGALAGVGVARLTRLLGASALVATLAGLAFGVSPTFWSRAVEIEAYTLNAAFVVAILYLALRLLRDHSDSNNAVHPQLPTLAPSVSAGVTNYQLRLGLLAFLFGLSLTNHLTTILLAPAVAAALLMGFAARRWTSTTPARISFSSVLRLAKRSFVLLLFFLGLSIYLYLPLRWPAINHGQALSWAGFVNILTGNEAKGAFQWRLPFQDAGRYPIVWGKIAAEFGWAGLGLAVLGVVSLLRAPTLGSRANPPIGQANRWPASWARAQDLAGRSGVVVVLALAYMGYLYFTLAFNVPDPDFSAFFIPLHLIAAVLMGLGIQFLLGLASRSPTLPNTHTPIRVLPVLAIAAFALLPMSSLWRSFSLVDRSGNWASQKAGELMLSQPLAGHAAILADSEKIAPLDYLQIAEGWRPDLDIIVLPDEASYRAALDERLAAGQVVYLGRYLPGLSSVYSLRSVGPLAEVSPTPFTASPLASQPPLAQPIANGVSLAGYAQVGGGSSLSGAAPGELDLTLVWHAQTTPAENLLVNLRLVDAAGQTGWQNAGSVPVGGLYPTNAWRAGETISDFYSLPIAPGLAPGAYQLQVALLPPFASAPDSDWTAVAPVTILPPALAPTPPHLLRDQFGPNWLLGYDIPEAVAPGSAYVVTLYWLRTSQMDTVPGPLSPAHPTSIAQWPVGALVPVAYRLTAPVSGSEIAIVVNGDVPAVCGWLAPPAHGCPLPAVRLAGQAAVEGAIDYDNQILLNRARLETTSAAPGGSVTVSLEWQALRAIGDDFTVFVHLLGPDGLVHGQIDRWPVSGTRATSSWAPGEPIVDPYVIQLPADAPPGAYQVEIGLYLLSTGERLPVLNKDGLPVDDRLLLTGLNVQSH